MGEERNSQKVEIKKGIDWTTLDLEPVEAFILSRIEPGMTLDDIFYISGLSRDETYRVIQSLVNKNLLFVEGFIPIKDELEISREEREKIDKFYNDLYRKNYYEILGVPFDAPLKIIKQQFYFLSKEFHPDRYFKKNIGEYKRKLEEIYLKIREAYEVLSDNASKEIYRESASAGIGIGKPQETEVRKEKEQKVESGDEKAEVVKDTHQTIVLNAIAERVKKAKALFEEGMKFFSEGNYTSALNNFKLSIAYDPFNNKYKEMMLKADAEVKRRKIKAVIEQAEIKEEMGEIDEAIALLEEVIRTGCNEAIAYHELAKLYFKKGENLQIAKNYCLKAIEIDPRKVDFYITLGEIYTKAGLLRNARREFERALTLQPENQKVKLFLEEIKRLEYGKK